MKLKVKVVILLILMSAAPAAGAGKIKSLCDIYYPSNARIPFECVELVSGDTPGGVFGRYWREGLRFNRVDRRHFGAGVSIKVPLDPEVLRGFTPMPDPYPGGESEPKLIVVNQTESYLGAYEYGRLVFSAPVALGMEGYPTPAGTFQIDAASRRHTSNLYRVEGTNRPYPMHYALRFHRDKLQETWPAYWIHGRDLTGYPVSHGCVGLYDEEMQKEYYGRPRQVELTDARWLFEWVTGPRAGVKKFQRVEGGPKVIVFGIPPGVGPAGAAPAQGAPGP